MNAERSNARRSLHLRPLAWCMALALGSGGDMVCAEEANAAFHGSRVEPLNGERPRTIRWRERLPSGHRFFASMPALLESRPPDRPAGALPVTNCNNAGPGSLRAAVDAAVSGDTIDMSALTCGQITLSSGALSTMAANLSLIGPGRESLSISGGGVHQVLRHRGTGTLSIQGLSITDGEVSSISDSVSGGCISSYGSVVLGQVTVASCRAESISGMVMGGAVFAVGSVGLVDSEVRDSYSSGTGGGIHALSGFTAIRSEIRSNEAMVAGGGLVVVDGAFASKYSTISGNYSATYGGGVIAVYRAVLVRNSTISGNAAVIGGGGLDLPGDVYTAVITNSTIADNHLLGDLDRGGAGIHSRMPLAVNSSTISGNVEWRTAPGRYGAGISASSSAAFELNNSIVTDNFRYLGGEFSRSDIRGHGSSTLVLTGADNLLGHLIAASAPSGTRLGAADLGPLQDNGGLTHTMMPLRRSPAINGGGVTGLTVDQRGIGFARQVGVAVDIGAVETDVLFADHFEVFHTVQP